MKYKLSVTIDENLVEEITRNLSTGKFRNKSHLVEFAVKEFLKNGEENSSKTSSIIQPTPPQTHPEEQDG